MRRLSPGKFFGAQGRFRLFPGFQILESKYAANLSLARHYHAEHNAFIVIDGAVTENGKYFFQPNSFGFQSPEFGHESVFGNRPTRILNLSFDKNWIETRLSNLTHVPVVQHIADDSTLTLARRLLFEFQIEDVASALSIESIVLELFALMSRRRDRSNLGRQNEWLTKVHEMIRDHDSPLLTVSSIASEIGVHPSHLTRAFKKTYGETVGEYLRKVRLERVAERLKHSSDPISAIAVDYGFSDQSHLTRMFRKQYGVTPARFKEMCA